MQDNHENNKKTFKLEKRNNLRLNHGIKKVLKQFSIFTYIGLLWTVISVFLMWLLIDVTGMPGWLGSAVVTTFTLFGKFYHYIYVRLISKNILKFLGTNMTISILTVFLISLFVDVFHFKAVYSSPIVIGFLFVLKFVIFKKIKLINEE